MKNEIRFEGAIKKAYAAKYEKFSLRTDQLESLYGQARTVFANRADKNKKRKKIIFILISTVSSAAAVLALSFLFYSKGVDDGSASAIREIERLQAKLEETKALRQEFAKLVEAYGIEVVNQLSATGANYESALVVAEENYVRNTGAFRNEFKSILEKSKENNERTRL